MSNQEIYGVFFRSITRHWPVSWSRKWEPRTTQTKIHWKLAILHFSEQLLLMVGDRFALPVSAVNRCEYSSHFIWLFKIARPNSRLPFIYVGRMTLNNTLENCILAHELMLKELGVISMTVTELVSCANRLQHCCTRACISLSRTHDSG